MVEQIVELLDQEPFVPFRIVLAGGERYDVTNPHLVAMGKSQIIVCLPKSDKWSILRINQITSVDVGQAA